MAESTTVEIDEDGRLTIPKPSRKKLGIDGENALLDLDVEVIDVE